jgi:hypothetical protein
MTTQMEDYRRNNAMQLLALLASTDVSSGAATSSAWVLELMTQNGFDDLRLLSGLNYAAEQNWLKVTPKGLWLTEAGKAAAASGWNAPPLRLCRAAIQY